MVDKTATLVDCDGLVFVLFSNVYDDIMEENEDLSDLRYGLKDDQFDTLARCDNVAEARQWCADNGWQVNEVIYA